MSYWVRDRARLTGREGIPLEQAVYLHTKEPADICGLTDRGALTVGLKADINVMDMERLRIQHPYVAYELPTGAKIWTQDVVGYDYTIIAGVITFKDNVKTGALPGGLVRNPRTQAVSRPTYMYRPNAQACNSASGGCVICDIRDVSKQFGCVR